MRLLFARISRVRRYAKYVPCLHEHMRRISYDEQRERKMRKHLESAYS